MPLPTEKTKAGGDPLKRPLLIYGPWKVGKSTLAAEIDPEHTLFIATEPGLDAFEVYTVAVSDWDGFLQVGSDLVNEKHDFKYVVVDTVDNLARFCADHVTSGMAQSAGIRGYAHASDFDYGKGWDAIKQEFQVKVAKLCQLGLGVIFISHEKEGMVKTRKGEEVQTVAPDVGQKGMRNFLLGYVDFIFHAEIIETENGKQHVLRTSAKVYDDVTTIEAGGRVKRESEPLPELIPLEAEQFKAAMARIA